MEDKSNLSRDSSQRTYVLYGFTPPHQIWAATLKFEMYIYFFQLQSFEKNIPEHVNKDLIAPVTCKRNVNFGHENCEFYLVNCEADYHNILRLLMLFF